MTTHRLTQKLKRVYRSRLIKMYGDVCFYCETPFLNVQHVIDGMTNPLSMEHDHLNDKEYDNRIENVVMSHKVCNQSKRLGNQKYILKAVDQLKNNERTGIIGFEPLEPTSDDEALRDYNEEIYDNTEFAKITLEYLVKHLPTNASKIPYKSSIDSITKICFDKVGHCSQNTIKRIMDMYASDEGDYYIYREGGKRWISKTNPLFSK